MGDPREPSGRRKMSQDPEDVSNTNQTEEYDEPTVESEPEEVSRGEDFINFFLIFIIR